MGAGWLGNGGSKKNGNNFGYVCARFAYILQRTACVPASRGLHLWQAVQLGNFYTAGGPSQLRLLQMVQTRYCFLQKKIPWVPCWVIFIEKCMPLSLRTSLYGPRGSIRARACVRARESRKLFLKHFHLFGAGRLGNGGPKKTSSQMAFKWQSVAIFGDLEPGGRFGFPSFELKGAIRGPKSRTLRPYLRNFVK